MLNQTPTLVQAASGNADRSVAGGRPRLLVGLRWSGPAPARRCLAVIATEGDPG
jgi:hypothetical protein